MGYAARREFADQVVGRGRQALASPQWIRGITPDVSDLYGIAYSPTLRRHVAVGDLDLAGTNPCILVSDDDGRTWAKRTPTIANATPLRAVHWGGFLGLFVAVGDWDGVQSYILTSPDGDVWTQQACPVGMGLYSVTDNGSVLCAVGWSDGVDADIVTSSDGAAWTEQVNPNAENLQAVTAHGADLVGVGLLGAVDAYMVKSTDNGATWSELASGVSGGDLYGVASNGVLLCAVGDDGSGQALLRMSDDDGVTWFSGGYPRNLNGNDVHMAYGVIWTGTLFLAVGAGFTTPISATRYSGALGTVDGQRWYPYATRAADQNIDLRAVAYHHGVVCAVGQALGAADYILSTRGIRGV